MNCSDYENMIYLLAVHRVILDNTGICVADAEDNLKDMIEVYNFK